MADTIREQIIAAFAARAAALSTLPVERAVRSRQSAELNGAKSVTVWDGDETVTGQQFGRVTQQFPLALNIQWEVADGVNNSVAANATLGTVIQSIISTDHTLDGLAKSLDYFTATPGYPPDGSGLIALDVIFIATYTTMLGDPFTQG